MILDVVQAAAELAPWWMSATAPWWATPVATLAGALLAWGLARLTSGRVERREDARDLREKRLAVYSEFWATGLAYTHVGVSQDEDRRSSIVVQAAQSMLAIELFGSSEVVEAAREVLFKMTDRAAPSEHAEAMSALRIKIGEELGPNRG